jgi:2-C-methyl-D-erythritol 2,4-cyclodiphosphate synthase
LVEGRSLILAGQVIPFDRGLAGHSDADAVAHALTDAILGAAAAGDIGRLFPDTDPAWKDADSIELLRQACHLVRGRGWSPVQADITVILERPKLVPHLPAMIQTLSQATGIAPGALGLKAKTNEGMGFIGRGEGIAVIAVASLDPI